MKDILQINHWRSEYGWREEVIKLGKYYYRSLWAFIQVEIFKQSPVYINKGFCSMKFKRMDKGFGEVEYKEFWTKTNENIREIMGLKERE